MASTKALSQEFAADMKAAVSTGPRKSATLLLYTIALFLIVAVVWARRATVDEVTISNGTVVSTRQVQVVQNLEGGILAEILVSEGDLVEAGQVLLRIDDTGFASTLAENEARYWGLLAALARLEAEANGTDMVVPAELADAPDVVAAERALMAARKTELNATLDVLRVQADQRSLEIIELEHRIVGLGKSLSFAQEELDIMTTMVAQGVASRVDLIRIQRSVADLDRELESARLTIPRAQAALEEAMQRQTERIAQFRTAAQAAINDETVRLRVLEQSLRSTQDRVTRTEVRAPIKGTVQIVTINTVGGVIQPGMDLVEIVPFEDRLFIEARVRPSDIAFLFPGQEAKVKLTAYDFGRYGALDGQLESISPDTIVDERGDSYYRIRVRTDRSFLGTEAEPLEILPGMVAQVDIITGEKTVLDYLLKPIIKARENALRER
jgi:adhesin transport system membrane fusion protein